MNNDDLIMSEKNFRELTRRALIVLIGRLGGKVNIKSTELIKVTSKTGFYINGTGDGLDFMLADKVPEGSDVVSAYEYHNEKENA